MQLIASDDALRSLRVPGFQEVLSMNTASILNAKARDGALVIISEHDLRLISALDAKVLTIHGGLLTE